MFIESLTPDQLVRFAQLLFLTSFTGGFLGCVACLKLSRLLGSVGEVREANG